MAEEIVDYSPGKILKISPRELIYRNLRYLPWFILSLAIMLILAYLKLRYSPIIFNVSGKLLVTTQTPYSKGNEKFDDIFMNQSSMKINDEIEIIRSRSMATRVVKVLGLQTMISNKGNIRSTIVHPQNLPFYLDIIEMSDSSRSFSFLVKFMKDQFTLNNQTEKKYHFNEIIDFQNIKLRLVPNNQVLSAFGSDEFIVSWQPLEAKAAELSNSIKVAQKNDFSNMLTLSYQGENIKLGVDIINAYMREYQKASLEDKREIAANTLQFIDDQLDTVKYNLGGVERNLQQYREKNRMFNPEQQSELIINEVSETKAKLTENHLRLKVVEQLISYLGDKSNPYRIVSSTTLGIEEPALLQQVTEFNKLQLERETALKRMPSGNNLILMMESQIEKLRKDMIENLNNIREVYLSAIRELNKKNEESDKNIKSLPAKQKQLLEVTRQQNILQELYSYLLQKKLETSISSASTISNIKIVESAMPSGAPVSPNRKALYVIATLLGLVIPVGIIFVVEYLNDKVKDRKDIQQLTNAPILGEIGHAEESGALVVTKTSRKFLAEQFRNIRSNLQYILPKVERHVIMVTSSFSGEGKSFISTNLGAVLALSGKKTVILEFDIRKPKIMKGLNLIERKGITNYIVGKVQLQEVIYSVPDVDNLYVIPCGPVPPNPAEMLLDEKIQQMFESLRKEYDVVIIDTAPVGLVSDGIILGKHADAAVYIVRQNYTYKKQVQLVDELYVNQKLPHLSIILNDVDIRSGYGSYYGYGYGYGYGGYYDETIKNKGFFRKLFSRINKK